MQTSTTSEASKIRKRIGLYNMIPNLFWSVICLVPISVFCYTLLPPVVFYSFLGVTIAGLFLPRSFFNSIQLSHSAGLYKRLGVPFINKFTQNGDLINRIIKKQFPAYKTVRFNQASIHKQVQQTYMLETFHFSLFIFFSLTIGYALVYGYWEWSLVLFITNLLYNIYPNLLQQYIRVKLKPFNKATPMAKNVSVKWACR